MESETVRQSNLLHLPRRVLPHHRLCVCVCVCVCVNEWWNEHEVRCRVALQRLMRRSIS